MNKELIKQALRIGLTYTSVEGTIWESVIIMEALQSLGETGYEESLARKRAYLSEHPELLD